MSLYMKCLKCLISVIFGLEIIWLYRFVILAILEQGKGFGNM